MKMKIGNPYGLFTLAISFVGLTFMATALPRDPEIVLAYLILIPFIMMGIFVVLIDIRNAMLRQLRYWEIMTSDIQKQKVKKK
jgi:hypothetical protein